MVSSLVLKYLGRLRLGYTTKTNFMTFQTVEPEIYWILIFLWKGLGLASHQILCFLKKNIFYVIFYQLTQFHSLVVFTSGDIGQYVYYDYLLSSLCDVIKYEITESEFMELTMNNFLIRSNALNIWLSHNLVMQSHGGRFPWKHK